MMKLFITLSCFIIATVLNGQEFICGNDSEEVQLKSATCMNWNIYSPVDPNDTPIKTIRITFHVVQKEDGTGNFPDNTTSRNWLQNIVSSVNAKFGNLQEMNLPTTSPHIIDSRIRFTLANIYFWQDDYGWSFQLSDSFGDSLYNKFVTNQPNVLFKNNSIHIFMSENSTGHGQASGYGDKSWIITAGIYANYLNNNSWDPPNHLSHELGHSCGLYHTWGGGDGCDDTPNNDNCWNVNEPWSQRPNADCTIPSNNLMDYNACKCALTICQVNRMHNALLGNIGNINDCVVSGINVQNPVVSGATLICSNGENYTISGLQLGVAVDWSATPSSYFTSSSGCGNTISIVPLSSSSGTSQLEFDFDWSDLGTTSISKNIWVGKASNLEICDVISPVYNAENISIPGSSCSSLIINNGQSVILHGNEILLNSGFEVQLGGILEIQTPSVCN